MEITEAQKLVDTWIQTYGIRYFNELTNTVILMEEVGEMSKIIARLYGEQSFKSNEQQENALNNLEEEMADVLFVLICLANQTGINLENALEKSLHKKTNRDIDRHQTNHKLKQ